MAEEKKKEAKSEEKPKEQAKPESDVKEQTKEEPKQEEPKQEEPKQEEPKQEEPKEQAEPEANEKAEPKAEEIAETEAPAAQTESKKGMPKELVNKVIEAVTIAKSTGKVSKGVNETTKSIERGIAKLVVVAENVSPEEIVMHLPILCNEKKVPIVYVPDKMELGKASGIGIQTAAVAITEEGDSKKLTTEIISTLETLK